MSDLTFPQPNAENAELAAANRRLTTAILGMTLLTGLVACLSYLAGRTVTHIKTETPTVRVEIPSAPVIVNPTPKPSPAPVAQVAVPAPVPAAPPAAPASVIPSGTYLQVGLMNPAQDKSMQERLVQRGYSVQLAPMENSPVARVLVGPVQTSEQQRELATKLQSDGYQFFPRRY